MEQTKQKIEIAKMCPHCVEWHDAAPYWLGAWSAFGEGNEYHAEFNPLHDLDAVHEAEKCLNEEQRIRCLMILAEITCEENVVDQMVAIWRAYHATSAQRCEALLRTLNLWTE